MSSLVLLDPSALDAGASLSFDDADGNCAGQCSLSDEKNATAPDKFALLTYSFGSNQF